MPVDADGLRADIVMDSGSRIDRMNLSSLYEMFFGAISMKVSNQIREILGIGKVEQYKALKHIKQLPPDVASHAYQQALELFSYMNEVQYQTMAKLNYEDYCLALSYYVAQDIILYSPSDNPIDMESLVGVMQQRYQPTYGPVTYVNGRGERVTTVENVRIAPLYMQLLEKIADDGSSVASGKLQHFGVLSPQTRSERNAKPFRDSPVRTIGETEGRLYASFCGREAIAEMMDRSNSPATHREACMNILQAEHPANIDVLVDRNKVPLGNSKPLQLVNHISLCAGYKTTYERS